MLSGAVLPCLVLLFCSFFALRLWAVGGRRWAVVAAWLGGWLWADVAAWWLLLDWCVCCVCGVVGAGLVFFVGLVCVCAVLAARARVFGVGRLQLWRLFRVEA